MDAMVTARMSQGKKEFGNRILSDLGINASQAINEFYDYIISNKRLPYQSQDEKRFSEQSVREALAFLDSIYVVPQEPFASMSDDELKQARLIKRGLAQKGDFA